MAGPATACGRESREEIGDAAYVEGRFADAYAAYAAAAPAASADIWAKLGAAAMGMGALDSAAEAYVRLEAEDPARTAEAADGLEIIARRAERAGDLGALRTALFALRRVAPERPLGRLTYALARRAALTPAEVVALLPSALGAAPDAAGFDRLLLRYAIALRDSEDCPAAAEAYRSVLRRSPAPALRNPAADGLARCAVELGLASLSGNRPVDADRWFTLAAQVDPASPAGRRALVGLGDARVAQGDPIAAAIAWQRAIDRGEPADSIARMASSRLRGLDLTDTAGDSSRMEI